MQESEIHAIVECQRRYFRSGATLTLAARRQALSALRRAMVEYADRVEAALAADLQKCALESFMCETGLAMSEMSYVQKHLARWMKDRTVPTPLSNFPARSLIRPSPYGVTLIMSPWNYPYLLSIEPMIDALAAGNTVVLKPSAYAPSVSAVLREMLESALPPELCAVVTGGREENQSLLSQKFDYIFFTGSQAVGREVLRRAAEHLTPATLELGGKSPVIVDHTADLALAARRIVCGKFLNAGQTCVAPDYILCEKSVKDELIRRMTSEIKRQLGDDPLRNPLYSGIINEKHFRRILSLADESKIVFGGNADPDSLRIEPTILDRVSFDDAVMQQEIFGPLLPVIALDNAEDAIDRINQGARPLALYVFTSDRAAARRFTSMISFGGGCINDTIMHLTSSAMGFGGIGESGMGAYHGKTGFDTFSHRKSLLDKKTWLDLPMRYRPYTRMGERLIRLFLR